MNYLDIAVKRDGPIAFLTINRPEKLNALRERTRKEMGSALRTFGSDSKVRCVVMEGGGGRAFSAGQDLSESMNVEPEVAKQWVKEFDELYADILSIPQPLVTSASGYATGSGWQVYLLGDYRIASTGARFAMTEINVGIPCITGSTILESLISLSEVNRLVLMAEMIDAKEAFRLGLVHKFVSDSNIKEETMKVAKILAEKPKVAVRLQKEFTRELFAKKLDLGVRRAITAHTKAFRSGEPQAIMTKFVNKRKKPN